MIPNWWKKQTGSSPSSSTGSCLNISMTKTICPPCLRWAQAQHLPHFQCAGRLIAQLAQISLVIPYRYMQRILSEGIANPKQAAVLCQLLHNTGLLPRYRRLGGADEGKRSWVPLNDGHCSRSVLVRNQFSGGPGGWLHFRSQINLRPGDHAQLQGHDLALA